MTASQIVKICQSTYTMCVLCLLMSHGMNGSVNPRNQDLFAARKKKYALSVELGFEEAVSLDDVMSDKCISKHS